MNGLGSSTGLRAETLHRGDNFHSFSDLAEHGVLAVEVREGIEAEEELRAVGVGACISHAQDAGAGVLPVEVLVVELVAVNALAASAISDSEVTTLGHEARDNSVEDAALEVEGLSRVAHAFLASAEGAEVL